MTYTSPEEQAVIASGGDSVRRGLVVGKRPIILQAEISAVYQDSETNGIYALDLTSITGTTDPTNMITGMTVEIGTTAGAHDIGTVRFRSTNATTTHLPIAETAPADLPVEVGHFITARYEFLPWQIPKRVVYTRDGSGNITAVTEYLDYDLPYPGGTNPLYPKANIVAGTNADGSWKEVRRVGWEDTPGCGYRTVTLDARAAVALNPGLTIVGVIWIPNDPGVTFEAGTGITDTVVVLHIPVGQVYMHLLVSDGYRQDMMHLPLWTLHPDTYPPLYNFNVTSDETDVTGGRDLQLEFFGNADEADDSVIPEKSLVCYFEEPRWNAGNTPPESYRSEVVGWVTDDEPILRLQNSKYGIKVGGTAAWKQKFRVNSIGLLDTGSTPTTYTEMQHITVNRAFDFSLYAEDSLRSLVNVYYTQCSTEVEALTTPQGDAWTAISELMPFAAMSGVGCDSLGNIYARRQYNFLSANQRTIVLETIRLTKADWYDADGLDLPTAKVNKVGVVTGAAEYWNSGRILYASQAPGLRSGYGVGMPQLPGQFVGLPTPQGDLNRLTGLFYWHENNPRPTVTLTLFGNYDVIEPCWQQPVLITWTDDTLRGTMLDNAPFLVKHISIQHSNLPDESTPPKRITLTLEQATIGADGETAPVLQMEGMEQVADTTCAVTAGFTWAFTDCAIAFTNTSSGDLIYAYLWDFGDGTFSFETNPTHFYPAAGIYTVTLYVVSECGALDVYSDDTVSNLETVTADFTYTGDPTVDFTDTSSADTGVVGWSWDFGDGTTSTDQNPSHTYAANDTYTVSLTVVSTCGNISAPHTEDVTISTIDPYIPPTQIFMQGDDQAAALSSDGHLYTCSNFVTGSPVATWTDHNLSASITPIDAAVDPFSPAYAGTGSTVDMYVLGLISGSFVIAKILDVFGSRTISTLYTINTNSTSSNASMYVSRFQANTLAVVYRTFSSGANFIKEPRIISTYDCVTFNDVAPSSYTPFPFGSNMFTMCPYIKADGSIRTISSIWTGSGTESHYFDSPDGISWTQGSQVIVGSVGAVNEKFFSYPTHDPSILYEFGDLPGGTSASVILQNGVDIAPTEPSNSTKVIAAQAYALAFDPTDETIMFLAGKSTGFTRNNWYDNGVGSFTQVNKVNTGSVERRNAILSDDGNHAVLTWGVGLIEYAPDLTTALVSRTPASKTFLAVAVLP